MFTRSLAFGCMTGETVYVGFEKSILDDITC